jgi:hypothetical protein
VIASTVARSISAWCNPGLQPTALAACNDHLALGGADGAVQVLDAHTLQLVQTFAPPSRPVGAAAGPAAAALSFSAAAEQLAVVYADGSMALLGLGDAQQVRSGRGHAAPGGIDGPAILHSPALRAQYSVDGAAHLLSRLRAVSLDQPRGRLWA